MEANEKNLAKDSESARPSANGTRLPVGVVLISYFALGAAATLAQSMILREVLVTFFGTELAIGSFYGSWFLWIALGAVASPRLQRLLKKQKTIPNAGEKELGGRTAAAQKLYLILHLAFPVLLCLQIALLRYWRVLSGISPLELATLEETIAAAFVAAMGPGFVIGALFPLAGRLIRTADRDPITRIYIWEAGGSLVGGLLFTYLLSIYLKPHQALAAIGFLETVAVAIGALYLGVGQTPTTQKARFWQQIKEGGRALAAGSSWRFGLGLAGFTALVWVVVASPLGGRAGQVTNRARWQTIQQGYKLVESRYTPYSHVSIGRAGHAKNEKGETARRGERVIFGLFNDGVLNATFPDRHLFAEQAAHIIVQNPEARRVLILGGGPEGLAQQLARFPSIDQIDCILQDPWATEMVRRRLDKRAQRALDGRRIRVINQDGRRYVNSGAQDKRYDLVVSLVAQPTTAALNRFFTLEFFKAVKRIAPDGVFMLFFHRDERVYLIQQERLALASIYRTLQTAYPHTTLQVGRFDYMTAAQQAILARDTATLAHRYRSLGLNSWPYPPNAFPGRSVDRKRSQALAARLSETSVTLNQDGRPITYFHTIAYLGRLSKSSFTALIERLSGLTGPAVFLLAALLFALCILKRCADPDPAAARRFHTALGLSTVGFASMTIQIVNLVAFQNTLGSLYAELGRLTGVLMAGLALGALAGRFVAAKTTRPRMLFIGALILMATLTALLPTLLATLAWRTAGLATAGFLTLSGVAGLSTGLVFPLAVAAYRAKKQSSKMPSTDVSPIGATEVASTAAALDAADHIGACIGGLATGALLIPLLGLDLSCWFGALLIGGAGILNALDLVFAHWGWRQKAVPPVRWSFLWKRLSWTLAAVVVVLVGGRWILAETPTDGDSGKRKNGGAKPISSDSAPAGQGAHSAFARRLLAKSPAAGMRVVEKKQPFPHLALYKQKHLAAVVFSTSHTAPNVRGYAGPIELIIRLKADGTLSSVQMGKHNETPSYIGGVPDWLKRFSGLAPRRPIYGAQGIDTLTGATVTTRALKKIIARSRRKAISELLRQSAGAQAEPPADEGSAENEPSWLARTVGKPAFWAVLILLGTALWAYLRATPGLRLLVLGMAAAVLGFWQNIPISSLDVGLMSQGQFPGSATKMLVVVGAALAALLLGQVWCGYLCPFGALQELWWMIFHRRGYRAAADLGQSRHISQKLEGGARYIKFLFLALLLSWFAFSQNQAIFFFDPMVWVFRFEHAFWRDVLLGVILLAALALFRPWCRYICPVGALIALSNKVALLDRRAARRRVNRCDIGVHTAKDVDCIRCNRCVRTKSFWL
jgi:spermidine synthase